MVRRLAGLLLAEPFAEMPEPRGESSLVAGLVVRSAIFSRVSHKTPVKSAKKVAGPLKSRAEHTDWGIVSQQFATTHQPVEI